MIIFSATKQGSWLADDLASDLRVLNEADAAGIDIEVIEGCYKGEMELAFITSNVEFGRMQAKKYKQESYLERGHYGVWYLIETETGNILQSFDKIVEVPKDRALKSDGWSKIDDKYYLGVFPRTYR